MTHLPAECEELRVTVERLRALLEALVVRGLRACGPDELAQVRSYAEHLERAGAGHVAGSLADLLGRIEKGDRGSARALLTAQTSVRMLERLLTLRVVRGQFEAAVAALDDPAGGGADEGGDDTNDADDKG